MTISITHMSTKLPSNLRGKTDKNRALELKNKSLRNDLGPVIGPAIFIIKEVFGKYNVITSLERNRKRLMICYRGKKSIQYTI